MPGGRGQAHKPGVDPPGPTIALGPTITPEPASPPGLTSPVGAAPPGCPDCPDWIGGIGWNGSACIIGHPLNPTGCAAGTSSPPKEVTRCSSAECPHRRPAGLHLPETSAGHLRVLLLHLLHELLDVPLENFLDLWVLRQH